MEKANMEGKSMMCCGEVITPKEMLLERAPGFLGWTGIIHGLTNLFDKGDVFVVTCWECRKCGGYTQSGIKKASPEFLARHFAENPRPQKEAVGVEK